MGQITLHATDAVTMDFSCPTGAAFSTVATEVARRSGGVEGRSGLGNAGAAASWLRRIFVGSTALVGVVVHERRPVAPSLTSPMLAREQMTRLLALALEPAASLLARLCGGVARRRVGPVPRLRRRWRAAALAAMAAAGLSASPVLAANFVWQGTTIDYNTNANWNPATAPVAAGQTAEFSNGGLANVNVSAAIAPDSWTFDNNAQNYTITGAQVTFGGATGITNNAVAGTTISIANVIAGATGVTQTGTGTLVLTGANTYSRPTTITNGVLQANASAALGNGSATNTLAFNGGTLQATGNITSPATRNVTLNGSDVIDTNGFTVSIAGVVSGAGVLDKIGTGTLALTNTNTNFGSVYVEGGTLQANSAASLGDQGPSNSLILQGGGLNTTATFTMTRSVFTGGAGGSIAANAGTTLTLSGTVLGSSPLSLDGPGTVAIAAADPFLSGTVTINGGTFALTGAGSIANVSLLLNSSVFDISGITATSTSLTRYAGAGSTTLGGKNLTITSGAGDTVSGVISGAGGSVTLAGGIETFTGANTYSGPTTITGGSTLQANSSAALGDGSATNTLIFNNGTLQATGAITSPATRGVTLTGAGTVDTNGNAVSVAGVVTGAGPLTKTGAGTLTLTGANTNSGSVTIAGGTLQANSSAALGDGSATNTLIFNNGTLQATGAIASPATRGVTLTGAGTVDTNGNAVSVAGVVTGAGPLTKTGAGTLTLAGVNTYTGATTISAGTLALTGTGSIATSSSVADNATFDISGTTAGASIVTLSGAGGVTLGAQTLTITNGSTTYAGVASGTGGFAVSGGTQTLSGVNTYTGATTIGGGATLALTGAGSVATSSGVADAGTFDISGTAAGASIATLSGAGGVTLGAQTLTITNGSTTYAGVASGTGGLTLSGGTEVLTGASTFTGLTRVTGGTLQLGDNTGAGSLASAVEIDTGGTFDLKRGVASTFANVVSTGAAGAANTKLFNLTGTGTTTLGYSNTAGQNFTGTININAGIVSIGTGQTIGDVTTTAATRRAIVAVNNGGTLHGTGTLDANVVVNNGGTVSAGNSPGTLTVSGDYTLTGGSNSIFELGASGIVGGANNDLIEVGHNLTLAGTLTLQDPNNGDAPLVTGAYRLFDYNTAALGGTVSGSFGTVLVAAGSTARVSTATPNQVNVFVNNGAQLMQFWDGADQTGNGVVDGGTGTWNAANTNWTYPPGAQINDQWQSQVGVFAGAAGVVTVAGTQNFQGLQFDTTGYVVQGDAINATGNPFTVAADQDLSFLNVTAALATINSNITGSPTTTAAGNPPAGIDKLGGGRLVLGGAANSYAGRTRVDAGVLEVAAGGNITGSSSLTSNAGFQLDPGATATFGSVTNSATGNIGVSNGSTMSGPVLANAGVIGNAGTWNNGTVQSNTGRIVNAVGTWTGDFTNNGGGTIDLVSGTLAGTLTNQQGGTVIAFGGQVNGAIGNSGAFAVNAAAPLTPAAFGIAAGTPAFVALTGQLANTGQFTGLAAFTNTATGQLGVAAGATMTVPSITNQAGGQAGNAGTVNAALANAGDVGNSGTWNGNATNSGRILNTGTWAGGLDTSGNVGNSGTWTGTLNNTGTLGNGGTWNGTVTNSGTFVNTGLVTGPLFNLAGAVVASSDGSFAAVTNAGLFAVPGAPALTAGSPASVAVGGYPANPGALTTTGAFDNLASGTVSLDPGYRLTATSMTNAGLINTAGTLTVATTLVLNPDRTPAAGGLRNTGTVNATAGAVNGGVVSSGAFNVTGAVTSDTSFVNQSGGQLSVTGAGTSYVISADLINDAGGTVRVGAGATLQDDLFNSGLVVNDGTYVAGTFFNLPGGTITGSGRFIGNFNNNGTYAPVGTTSTVQGNLTNAGIIDLTTEKTTTTALTITGTYLGVAGSQLAVNVDLNAAGVTPTAGTSNRLSIGGTAAGSTTVTFADLTGSKNAIAFYPQIPVVTTGNNDNTAFTADPASLAALSNGFVSYVFNNGSLLGAINAAQATAAAGQISAVLTTLNTDFFQDFQPFITAPQDPDANLMAGGIWVRGKYGVDTFDSVASSPLSSNPSRVATEFAGFQVGGDIGRFNIDKSGWNVVGGVTAGEVFSNSREKVAGLLRGDFEIPFVGVYGLVSNGGFRFTALYRHDFYGLRLNDAANGLANRRLDADGDSISMDTGYNIPLGNFGAAGNLFFDPSASLILSKVTVNNLAFGGQLGTLRFNDIDSALGRAGFRFGSSMVAGEVALQPFVTASVWHEFAKNSTSTLDINNFNVPLSVTRIGTFGQFGLGLNGELLGKNILGTIRADFRTGDKVDGQSVTAQLRYQF